MEITEEKILSRDDLRLPEWQKKAEASIKMAEADTENSAVAEAQNALLNFIMNLGGVRQDVYEYLLFHQFQNTASVASIGTLLCYAAPLEWIRLATDALENDRVAGVMYVNEITEAYKEHIPVRVVKEFIKNSDTAFMMCQHRIHYMAGVRLHDSVAGSDADKPRDNVTGSGASEPRDSVAGSDADKPRDNVTGSGASEPRDSVAQSDEIQPHDSVAGSSKVLREEEEAEEVKPQFPDGAEILDGRVLVKELEEAEAEQEQRVSFFQMLLSRHMKKVFSKLDEEEQTAKIFEVMVQKYGKDQILAIRRLMDSGMANEFIFSLLEKNLPAKELMELTDTLLMETPDINLQAESLAVEEMPEEEVISV